MKRQLILVSALTLTSALAGDEDAIVVHRELVKGGKPNSTLPLQTNRDLRQRRRTKSGKAVPPQDDGGHDMDDDGDDDGHGSKSGKRSKTKGGKGGGGKAPGSKSGKSSKDDVDMTPYYMASFSCTNKCIDADGADFRTGALNKAVKPCSTHESDSETQQWILHATNDLVQVESYAYMGKCIAVDYKQGDNTKAIRESCDDGNLALLPCEDPASHWYFTGGQLLSFFCWSKGVSATMGVSYDEDKEKCHEELLSTSFSESMASTFMFITSKDMHAMYDVPDDETVAPTFSPTLSPTMAPSYMPTISPNEN